MSSVDEREAMASEPQQPQDIESPSEVSASNDATAEVSGLSEPASTSDTSTPEEANALPDADRSPSSIDEPTPANNTTATDVNPVNVANPISPAESGNDTSAVVAKGLDLTYVPPAEKKSKDSNQIRDDILELYKKGHQENFEYPPWEQPDFGIYHRVDRWGFIHERDLPPVTAEEQESREKSRERELKWAKMFADWNKFYGKGKNISTKLRDRTYKGIPDSVRGSAWTKFLDIEQLTQPGVYQNLKDNLRDSPDLYQIDIDINRTFRDHVAFKDRYCIKQQEAFYVLAAYSIHNKDIGYCQGMSGIVALLLLYMGEEEAFWALHALFASKKHGMHELFLPGFPKLLARWELHEALLKKKLRKLSTHLEKESVQPSAYSSKWFLQCFQDKLPFYTVLRLWDVFLLDGYSVVSAAALAIMVLYEQKLLSMDFDGILMFLSAHLESEEVDTDRLLKLTRKFTKLDGL